MGWIKRKLKEIFYKEPNVKPNPIQVEPSPTGKFDFHSWDGKFADLSHWEEHFDINTYNCPILLNKCTDAINFIDGTHKLRQQACEKKGILYGGYHFWSAFKDPEEQAKFYITNHGVFTLPPILDFETNGSQTVGDLKNSINNAYKFLLAVEAYSGKTPIIYMNPSIAEYCHFDARFGRFPLWIAAYKRSTPPICPKPWSRWFAWQYTESDFLAGCGSSDISLYDKAWDLFGLNK